MTPPGWMQETIAEFGRAAGIEHFAFNERGVAALGFESGASLVFEYAYSSLNVMMTVPADLDAGTAAKTLSFAAPERRGDFRIKAGFFGKAGKVFFATRLPHDEVSLPTINAAFSALRRLADSFGEGTR